MPIGVIQEQIKIDDVFVWQEQAVQMFSKVIEFKWILERYIHTSLYSQNG